VPPFAKLIDATAKRRQAFIELLLLDQQLWHACLSDQVDAAASCMTVTTSEYLCSFDSRRVAEKPPMRCQHVAPHTSYLTPHTSHVARHTSHLTRYTSHITRHTSHVTHTSRITRRGFQVISLSESTGWEAIVRGARSFLRAGRQRRLCVA
jgi:hypothetical protein